MKEVYNIEERLHSGAQHKRTDVDTDELWASIESELPPQKKRRLIPFWILGIFAFGVSGFALSYLMNDTYNENEKESLKSEITNEEDLQYAKETEAKLNVVGDTQEAKSIESINQSIITSGELPELKNDLVNHQEIKQLNEGLISNGINEEDSNDLTEKGNQTSIPFLLRNDDGISADPTVIDGGANHLSSSEVSNPEETPEVLLHRVGVEQLGLLSINNFLVSQYLPAAPAYRHRMPWRKNEYRWKIGLSAGYSNAITSFGIKDIDFRDHLLNRQMAESSLSSWHARGNVSFLLNSEWSIKTGIRYTQLYRQSATTISTSETITLDNVVIERIIGPDGVDEITGSIEVLQETISDVNRINSYQYVDGEVLLIRSIDFDLIDVTIGAGVNYGLSYTQNGYIHPINTEEYDLSADNQDWYNSSVGLGGIIELGLQYPLSDFIDFEINGQYTQPIQAISSTNYGLRERRNVYHISVGLGYKL